MYAVEILNMSKKYSLADKVISAVDNLSYKFEYGKMYAIMGHSGSGKSTLIQCLGLLDRINDGNIFINGKNVNKMKSSEQNELRNRRIGFIFQNYYLNNSMKAYENVMLPMLINDSFKNKNIKKYSMKLLEQVGLTNRLNHYPKQLSGGEQQRVAIARAIANNPDIILADEPTGNLDEENEKFILELLNKMSKKGKCVIVVSHNSIIKKYADVVINMKNGKFVELNNEV